MVDAELDRCDFEDDELGDDELVLGEYDMRRVQRRRTFPLSYSPRTGAAPHQGRLFLFRRGGMLLRQLFQHPLQDRSPFFGYPYRAAPVFAAPPCPVGADCVALGPFAVDVHDQIAPSTSMARRNAPMPHQAR